MTPDSGDAGVRVVETPAPPVVERRVTQSSGDPEKWRFLPDVMKSLPQWAIAGADKAPRAVAPDGTTLRYVSVTRPSEWMTFEQACQAAWDNRHVVTTHRTKDGRVIEQAGFDIGFILTESDPLACIDLDVKDASTHPDNPEMWTSPDGFQFYTRIVHSFDSYTERSRSGKGLHIWVEGNIGRGFKRDGVEVYSQERFIICTGDAWVNKPVANREMMLLNMVSQMRPAKNEIVLEELEPDADDWYVFQTAATAANRDKFWELWYGNWQKLGYPSQSEADLSLMSMLTFYSDSNAQCRRLFRESGLGQREKTRKNDYHVNRLLKMIRERQESERNVEISALLNAARTVQEAAAAEIAVLQGGAPAQLGIQTPLGAQEPRTITPLQVSGQGDPVQPTPQADSELAQMAPVSPEAFQAGETGLQWPPGFVGALARFIYSSSWLPIKEVSVVAALGLMAGLTGKAWHIPKSGLNLYIILVARSAIGKEGMHDGISTLVNSCIQKYGPFSNFVDFNEYASGPALVKACLAAQSFVNVSGEWGRKLKRIANEDNRDGPLATLRTQMTNLYQKSGPQSIAGGISYSSAENNVASVQGVAYSMIGETTPGTFYESLTQSMMEDGFLSRFLIVGYEGDRPDENHNIVVTPDDALRDQLVGIAAQAHRLMTANDSQLVGRTEEAAAIITAFSAEANANIRKTDDESRRQMWNRAVLKALRIAGILAVGDHYTFPVISADHINWAIQIVRRDIEMMRKRLDSGDVGSGDISRQRKLMSFIREYVTRKGPIPKSYKVDEKMRANSIVTRSYLQMRVQQTAAFYNHKLGLNKGLDEAIKGCIENGYLMVVKDDKLAEGYSFHGKAYRILNIPDYSELSER